MGFKFNPTTGKLDTVADPGGADTNVQFNDSSQFGGTSDLTYDKTSKVLTNKGDINLNDGGSFTTTLQCVTPTANRTLSLPDATGTVALVAGSNQQVLFNSSGANAGISTFTYDGTILTSSGRFVNSYNAAASAPAKAFTGTWFTGGTATTTKPHFLIEPTGTTSTGWSTSGTGLGVNAASGFAGNLLDLQVNGVSQLAITSGGVIKARSGINASIAMNSSQGVFLTVNDTTLAPSVQLLLTSGDLISSDGARFRWGNGYFTAPSAGYFGFSSFSNGAGSEGDARLYRDAANTLAQRNTTNAQVFRIYNTFTSATDNELGKTGWERSTSDASTNGFISGTTLTVDSGTGIAAGQIVTGTGVIAGTRIISGSGTSWVVSQTQTVGTTGARVAMVFGAPAFRVGTEKGSGGGTARAMEIQTDGTTRLTVAANGSTITAASGSALVADHRLSGTAPANATATGTAGDIRYDADYIYICTATNTWKRAAIATW